MQVSSASSVEELKSVVIDNSELIIESGITKPFTKLSMDDKVSIVQSVALHSVILKTLGELSEFRDGLQSLGVAQAMSANGELLRNFYVKGNSKVTAGNNE